LTVILGVGLTTPGWTAERLAISFGPVKQSIAIADLEKFAKTGEISPDLQAYSAFLNNDVQMALTSRLQLDPQVSDKLVNDLLQSSTGERVLSLLELLIADSTPTEIQTALMLAAQQNDGLSLLGFLKSYPDKTITIDGTSTVALASQLNLPYWQSQALSSILERELTVESTELLNTNIDPTESGTYWVRQQTLTLRDYERDRTIPVDLYWSRRSRGPLVIISHGFGADRRFLNYLAYHLASYGLTVAALEHPASNVTWLTEIASDPSRTSNLDDIFPASEFIDRPKDISFLIDQLDRLNRYSTILHGKLNTNQVTVIGHSLGGYTALALAGAELDFSGLRQFCSEISPAGLSPADWLQCTATELSDEKINLRDPRVAQIIALSPVVGHLFSEASLNHISIPTLILTGTDDTIAPTVSQQLLPFTELRSPKYLLTAIGATHLSVGDPANLNHALTDNLFVRERRGEETEPLRELLKGISLAFIMQLTPEANQYHPFLSSTYAQSFSTTDLKLRLNTTLPPSLTKWLRIVALPLENIVSRSLPKRTKPEEGMTFVKVIDRLPLVMFILPGNLPLVGRQFLQFRRRQRKNKHD
jgi:predicted dienelactone hydrolase